MAAIDRITHYQKLIDALYDAQLRTAGSSVVTATVDGLTYTYKSPAAIEKAIRIFENRLAQLRGHGRKVVITYT